MQSYGDSCNSIPSHRRPSFEEKMLATPTGVQVVLGIEWVITVVTILISLACLIVRLLWKTVVENKSSFQITEDDTITSLELGILVAIPIALTLMNMTLILLLGKGIVERSPVKCKIWLVATIILFLLCLGLFGFSLLANYFQSSFFLGLIAIFGYKLLAITIIRNFIHQLENERADEIKLFPSTNL